jgi:hypothetical protein
LRALLLQVLYSLRTERMLMEQLEYRLLFRWFVGPNMDDPIWDVTVFTKNRQRLLAGNIADAFFAVLKQARQRDLLSDEHFTVDGTLLEAWAGQKSFRHVDDDRQPLTETGEGSNPCSYQPNLTQVYSDWGKRKRAVSYFRYFRLAALPQPPGVNFYPTTDPRTQQLVSKTLW